MKRFSSTDLPVSILRRQQQQQQQQQWGSKILGCYNPPTALSSSRCYRVLSTYETTIRRRPSATFSSSSSSSFGTPFNLLTFNSAGKRPRPREQHQQQQQQQQHRMFSSSSSSSNEPPTTTTAATSTTNAEDDDDRPPLPPIWLQHIIDQDDSKTATATKMESRKVYKYLQLEQFTNEEINRKFDTITTGGDFMNKQQLDVYIFETIHQIEQNEQKEHNEKHEQQQQRPPELEQWKKRYAEIQSQQLWNYLLGSPNNTTTTTSSISRDEFSNSVLSTAKSVDVQRIWPLTLSMLMVGSTVGVTTPAMVRLSLRFF
jgi:hypothetical protein